MKALETHRGSAKNTKIYERPTKTKTGVGGVEFLQYISLFDYGQFKNSPIPFKETAMKFQTIKNFDLLNGAGIYNHYRGLNEKGEMLIDLVRVPEAYKDIAVGSVNYLLPIEIVFREWTHPASSDLKAILKGKKTWQELGYEEMPVANTQLPHVKISYQTKLEDEDRTLTRAEAQKLAGLTNKEIDELEEIALSVNKGTTKHAAGIGLKPHYDGKMEAAKDPKGSLMVVDAEGTLDEDRFGVRIGNGVYVDVSKQFFRNFYTTNGFKAQTDAAKERAEKEGVHDWTTFCSQPPKMPEQIATLGSRMYLATVLDWAPEYKYAILEGINAGYPEEKIDSSDLDIVPPLSSVAKDLYVAEKVHEALRATGRNFDDIYDVICVD